MLLRVDDSGRNGVAGSGAKQGCRKSSLARFARFGRIFLLVFIRPLHPGKQVVVLVRLAALLLDDDPMARGHIFV